MTLLDLLTNTYPCNLYQVRQANPNVSFPATPTDEDLQPFGYVNVHPTPQPIYDQRTERIEEATPEPDADGSYRQKWAARPATADETAAYDIAHVDALWQEQQWGRDPLAEKAEAERRTDLAAAVHFLRLLAG